MAEAQNKSRPEIEEIGEDEVEDIFQCSICHNEMNEVSITHCGHLFCTGCIDKWIKQCPNCPQCREYVYSGHLIDGRSVIEIKNRIRTLETAYRSGSLYAMEQKEALVEQLRQKSKEILTMKAQFDEADKENTHLKMQIQSTKDDLNSQKKQLKKSETTIKQTKEVVETLSQQKQVLDGKLEATRQECLQLGEKVSTLKMYEKLHEDASQQLQFYINTVLPNRDSSIVKLQQIISDLHREKAELSQDNISLHQHVQNLQTTLKTTTQQLQQYFEEEYGTKIAKLEKINEVVRKQLNEKETELQNRVDVGDELKTAARTYKKLIKENCDLKDQVKTRETRIKQLTKDIGHSKERANELERKISFLKMTSEE